MSQNLLTISNLLNELHLKFIQIDGDKNDLSWFYTMNKFPSLIIFPGENKSESRIFPATFKVNLKNILGFILSNLNRPTRFYAMLLSCRLTTVNIKLNCNKNFNQQFFYLSLEIKLPNRLHRNTPL